MRSSAVVGLDLQIIVPRDIGAESVDQDDLVDDVS